jgi:inner membrane protease subunit 1
LRCNQLSTRFSTGKANQNLSRTERRVLERKQKNKERKEAARTNKDSKDPKKVVSGSVLTAMRQRVARILHPKVPGGGNLYFKGNHLKYLGYRLPLAVAVCYLLSNDDFSPYIIQGSIGPSMLPTIQFIGDLWLIETMAWHRLFDLETPLQNGDLVIWKDPSTERVSCKRVIGLEDDEVLRYGEYAQLYQHREDWGIVKPNDTEESRNLNFDWDKSEGNIESSRTMVVPSGHVWLEGDCPPFSLDSRHFGPIPISWIRGRLIYRVWPISREDEDGNPIPCSLDHHRPVPFPSIESYLGKKFNFYRIPKVRERSDR